MGILPDVLGSIGSTFKNLGSQIGNGITSVYGSVTDKLTGTINKIVGTVEKLVGSVLSGIKDSGDKIVSKVFETQNNIISSAKEVVTHGEDTVGGIAKDLTWPLVAVAAALGIFVLKK
jgi:phage-related protein